MKGEKLILIVLAGLNFTHILDFMVMMPLAPQIKRAFDVGSTEWSIIISSYSFAAFISGLLSIFFIDRINRKKLLLITYVGFLIGTLAVGLSHTYHILIATRFATGIFGGLINALILSIVTDLVPYERRGAAMGIIMTGFSAAAALGVPIGNYFGVKFGWNFPFFLIAGLGVLLFTLVLWQLPSIEPKANKKVAFWEPVRVVISIFKDKDQFRALFFMMIVIIGHFSIIPFLSPYMVSNVGFEEIQLSYIYFLGGMFTFVANPIIGKIVDRVGKQKGYVVFLLISLIPVFLITHLGVTPIWVVLVYTTMFFVFVGGRFIPATAVVISAAKPDQRGIFMSVRSSVMQLSSGFAAFIAGVIVSEDAAGTVIGYDMVGYLSIILGLLTIPLIYTFKVKS